MTAVDASTGGRRNRANGATAERDVARYLRPWLPDARRAVVNGWTSGEHRVVDPLDIDGIGPGLCISVKACQREYIGAWMAELEAKRDGRFGLLVVRRKGHSSPGEWWCWMRLIDLHELLDCHPEEIPPTPAAPVRMELRHVMPLLVSANYASAPVETSGSTS